MNSQFDPPEVVITVEHARRPLTITLPAIGDLDQHEEFCDVVLPDDTAFGTAGESVRIRFHDYAKIFQIPGLYEQLFADLLQCRSPEVLVDLLGAALGEAHGKPADLRVLDLGAGNGMVGEQLVRLGVGAVVGVDLLPEAREAATRDRPSVYSAYVADDITALRPADRSLLADARLNCLTCVAALGFDDIPPAVFGAAFNSIADQGWIAFNLRDRYVDRPGAFAQLLTRLEDEGVLEPVAQTRYRHRLSVSGTGLDYVAVVARKHGHIPSNWLQ